MRIVAIAAMVSAFFMVLKVATYPIDERRAEERALLEQVMQSTEYHIEAEHYAQRAGR